MSRRYFCPVRKRKLSSFQRCFWPWCWGLDVRVPYHSGMTGTVRDITQTRVSHHSEPSVVGRRSCTGFPTQHWVDVPALLPLTHLQSWASYRTSVGLTFVTFTLPAGRRHQPALPRAQSGTEAGACQRRGGGAAGGAGGVSWEAPAPWAETGRARGSRGCGGAPSSWRAWGPDSSEARARLPGTALSPSPGEALRRPTALEPGRRSQPPPLPPRAWGPGRLGKRSTQLPPGRVQFLRVSQRGSLVLGVWTHARAGGGQELELSPVSHREGGEGPA